MTATALFSSQADGKAWADALPDGAIGRETFEYHACLESTQDRVVELSKSGCCTGAVVVAEEQSAGRGRRGSTWIGAAGQTVLFSVLANSRGSDCSGYLAMGSAFAVARSVEELCGLSPSIKWPNDLLLNGLKFCGILVEVCDERAVIGVGVNVNQQHGGFAGELEGRATSISVAAGVEVDRQWLLGLILCNLGAVLVDANVEWSTIRQEVASRLAWRGKRVRTNRAEGTLTGLDDEGALLVETDDGLVAVTSGSLELI